MWKWFGLGGGLVALALVLMRADLVRTDYHYETVPVARADVLKAITATGRVLPEQTVEVGSQLSGQIKELLADYNDRISAGQVIARLDPATFEVKVQEARAELATAREAVRLQTEEVVRAEAELARAQRTVRVLDARLARAEAEAKKAQQNLRRKRELAARNAGSLKDVDDAAADLAGARASVEAAKAELDVQQATIRAAASAAGTARIRVDSARTEVTQREARLRGAELDLTRTVIRAPVAGVIIRRDVSVGQTVAASLQAPTLFSIATDLRRMRVEANVDEADIGQIQVGQHAVFAVDAYPGQRFFGQVMRIRKSPQQVQNVVTYVVEISADNPDQKLLPGITALVRIAVDQAKNAVVVPNAALRFVPPAAGNGVAAGGSVWVPDGSGAPRLVAIRTGISDSEVTVVIGGALKDGQPVIVGAEPAGRSIALLGLRIGL